MAIAVALAGAAPAAAQQTTKPEMVATTFDWPVGTRGMATTYQRTMRSGDAASDVTIEGTYEFDVEAHPEGVFVRHHTFATTNFTSVPELPPNNPLSLLYSRLGAVSPNYVVASSGELLRVEGLQEMRDQMRAALAPVFDSIPEQVPQLDAMVQQLTSEQFLFNQITEQWNLMVGFWIDAELELGALYEFEDVAPSPLIPTELIPFLFQFAAAERVACSDAHEPDSCVRFEFYSAPDPEVIEELLEGWLAQLGGPAAGWIESIKQENTVIMIAEPATLLPYRWEMTRSVSMLGRENGQASKAENLEKTVYTFSYR